MLKRNTTKFWYKRKVHKEAIFPWSIIHKVVVMNKRRGWTLAKIDKSRSCCGLSVVESMEHRFFNCPLAPPVCYYEVNIIGQLYVKRDNGGPRKPFSTMHCLCDQPISKSLKPFSRIWFFLRNGLPWIIWRQRNDQVLNALPRPVAKIHQVVWDSLLDYGRLEWQQTLMDLEKNTGCCLWGCS